MNLLVHDFLEASANRHPSKVCLVCDGARYTYGAVDAMANRLANALRSHGVRRGDRVAIYLPNSLALVVGVFAVLKADACFVPLNRSVKPDKLKRILENCRPSALIAHSQNVQLAAALVDELDFLHAVVIAADANEPPSLPASSAKPLLNWEAIQEQFPPTRPERQVIDQDLACLIYTSGSTGDSKGVMSSHSNVVFAASSIVSFLANVPEDVIYCALPLSFDYGLYQLLMTFQVGATLVLDRSFTFAGHILRQLEAERVTGLPGVPTMFNMLLNIDVSDKDLSSLRYFTNTAAALPVNHIEELSRRFPQVTIFSMYGLTETKRTLYLPPKQLHQRPGSVGIAIPGTEVWLVDDQDRRLGPNEVGELVVRGRHVMRGYWGDAKASASRFRAGPIPGEHVCYSGDLFRHDEDGFYYFVGRKDDILKCRGEKVPPKEVEEALYRHPHVVEAAVIGVPDPVLGNSIRAFVVRQSDQITERELLAHCRQHLEDFMVPQRVVFVDELPKSANGKIQKSLLPLD